MHWLDWTIIAAAFVGFFVVALILQRRAGQNIDSYFLGNRQMSWWMLGASGMASNVDMAGTMLNASLVFMLGFSGFFIELRGGVVLIMAFYLAFMGKWTRRSGKMTIAEWMEFRFGTGPQGNWPRLLSALGNILFLVTTVAFFAKGAEKFLAAFLPEGWDPALCSAALMLIVMVYTTMAGFAGVVWTDILQGGLILFMAVFVSVKGYLAVDGNTLATLADANWFALVPATQIAPPPDYEAFEYLRFAVLFYFLKTAFDGMSGAGGYFAQRYFAAKNERECAPLSAFWIVLMAFRWPMIMGVAVLGLTLREQIQDPEMVLPVVIREIAPLGIRGLLLVALIGAAMSTYSSIINGGASYFVKDIYQAFLRKDASERELVGASYISTVAFVGLGLLLAYQLEQINTIWGWLMMGLGTGLIIPNFLRWYWWRLNGYGFAAGVAAGILVAVGQLVYTKVFEQEALAEYTTFLLVAGAATLAMVVVSFLTPAVPRGVLDNFFRVTRPFGFWGPMRATLPAEEQRAIARENVGELLMLVLAVPWQVALFLLPMAVVAHQWSAASGLGVAVVVLSVGMYWAWKRGA